jgi:hypothetical protein
MTATEPINTPAMTFKTISVELEMMETISTSVFFMGPTGEKVKKRSQKTGARSQNSNKVLIKRFSTFW